MKNGSLILCFLLIATITSCDVVVSRNEFETNRNAWKTLAASNYTYKYNRLGMPLPPGNPSYPLKVTVTNQVVTLVVDSNGVALSALEISSNNFHKTIDQCFETISTAISGDSNTKAATGKITVVYNSTYSFPSYCNIDWIKDAIDDDESWEIQEFNLIN